MAIVSKLVEYSTELNATGASARERFRVHATTQGETVSAAQAYSAVGRSIGNNAMSVPGLAYSIVVVSIGMTRVEEAGGNVWDVEVGFGPAASSGVGGSTWSMSSDIGGEYVDVWRTGITYPTNGAVSSMTSDIGGTPVDQNGQPLSVFKTQSTFSITVQKYTSAFFASIWSSIGTRNSASFQGASAGQVLFTGARVQVNGDCNWSVTYNFVSDPAYHLIQRPLKDSVDGNPVLNTNKQAAQVYFFQPYPTLTDFANMIGGNPPTCNA